MGIIRIGPMCVEDNENICQIVSLDRTADKTFLRVAESKGCAKPLIGRPYRTAVILIDGTIILTPFSAKIIFAHIQEDS